MNKTLNIIISEKKALKTILLQKQNYYAQYHLIRQLNEVTNIINHINNDLLHLEEAANNNEPELQTFKMIK